eukprot:IDg3656t1
MFYSNEYSVPTEELPSTDQESVGVSTSQQEEKMRNFHSDALVGREGEEAQEPVLAIPEPNRYRGRQPTPYRNPRQETVGQTHLRPRLAVDPPRAPGKDVAVLKRRVPDQGSVRALPSKRARTVCYRCYSIGHISPSCGVDPKYQAMTILSNWTVLNRDEQD